MGYGIAAVQNVLELWKLGYLDNKKKVIEFGSQELHLKASDFFDMLDMFGVDKFHKSQFQNIENWPNQPRASSRYLYELLGFENYYSLDLNNDHHSIDHDFNLPFEQKNWFSQFDLVTDHCACGHAFNIAEAYTTMHKLCKPGGLIISLLPLWNGNAYYMYDNHFFEGIAAANSYNIIFNSYVVDTGEYTPHGSNLAFHIPTSRSLLNTIDKSKSPWFGVCAVLQKTSDDVFQYPYQGQYLAQKQNHYGFNRVYHRDRPEYSYIPMYDINSLRSKKLISELIKRLKSRIKPKLMKSKEVCC